jgi:hypothetical protein
MLKPALATPAQRGRIELEPFGRLDAATHRALDAEAERLAAFHA